MKNFLIQKEYKWYNYIMPFQSFRQFLDTLATSMMISAAVCILSGFSLYEFIVMLLMSWFFSALACHMFLPAAMIVDTKNLENDFLLLKKILLLQGYHSKENESSVTYFPMIFEKIPWKNISNYMIWSENLLKITVKPEIIIIRGPIFMVKIIAEKYAFHD